MLTEVDFRDTLGYSSSVIYIKWKKKASGVKTEDDEATGIVSC